MQQKQIPNENKPLSTHVLSILQDMKIASLKHQDRGQSYLGKTYLQAIIYLNTACSPTIFKHQVTRIARSDRGSGEAAAQM